MNKMDYSFKPKQKKGFSQVKPLDSTYLEYSRVEGQGWVGCPNCALSGGEPVAVNGEPPAKRPARPSSSNALGSPPRGRGKKYLFYYLIYHEKQTLQCYLKKIFLSLIIMYLIVLSTFFMNSSG